MNFKGISYVNWTIPQRGYIKFRGISYVGFQFFMYNFVPNLSTLILTPKICISQFVKKTDAVTFLFEKHLIVTFLFEKHLPVTFLFKNPWPSHFFFVIWISNKNLPQPKRILMSPLLPLSFLNQKRKTPPPSPIQWLWKRVHLRQSFQLNWERVQHISLYEAP